MASYSAGTLNVELLGANTNAIQSIQATAKALNSLSNAINKINNAQFVLAGQKLEHLFEKIAVATNSINVGNITALASVTKSLGSLSKLGNLEKMDFAKIGKGFQELSIAITPFLNKVKEAETSLNALYAVVQKTSGKKFGQLMQYDKGIGFGSLFSVGKITASIYAMTRLGRAVARITKLGSDYVETLNLWQVAMRDNLSMATEFVDKMNRAYSISEKTVMNAQATFKNMIGSLGDLSSETAYQLSEAITQMAVDYSSLYNVSIENAINKFQSALAGQVRPIRSISGYDITEKTIYAVYEALGGTKTMRQLSRTEKQLLSIYAVFNQMSASGALGDMTKTLDNFANQSRMMAENWERLGTWTGVIIQHLLQTSGIMVKINALLITATEIVKALATDIGAGQENFIDGIFESANLTNKEIDELQGKLLDFDKFRSLSGGEEETVKLDEALLQALSGYSGYIDNAQNSARELAGTWLEILGFVKDTNGNFVATDEALNSIKNTLSSIVGVIGILIGVKGIGGITTAIKGLFGLITAHPILAVIVAVVGYLLTTSEEFRNSLSDLFKSLKPIIDIVINLVNQLLPILTTLLNAIEPIVTATITAITLLLQAVMVLITPIFYVLEALIKTLETIFEFIYALTTWNWSSFGSKMGDIWGKWGSNDYAKNAWNIANAKPYANGGMPDKGTVFVAGEAGAEMVYNAPSGQSGVANIKQIAEAMYSGAMRALSDWWGGSQAKSDIPQFREFSRTGIYEVAKSEMIRRGEW